MSDNPTRRSRRSPRLVTAVQEFVDADSWAAARVTVEREPRLLSEAADGVLADLVAQAAAHDDEHAERVFTAHRETLRRVRPDGLAYLDELVGDGVPEPLRGRWVEAELSYERYRREPTLARGEAVLGDVDGVLADPAFSAVTADRRAGMAQAAAGVAIAHYLATDTVDDLGRAIELYRTTLAQLPEDHPDRAAAASALGSALCLRYERTGAPDDLDDGIASTRRAVPGAPAEERWLVLHNLAANLGMRYALLGVPDDLCAAFDAVRDALAAEPPPEAAPRLVHTAAGLLVDRFERDGGLDDLETAAELVDNALPAATTSDERAPLRVVRASVAQLRFSVDGDVRRLDEAATQLRRAVRELGRRSAHRPVCLQLLGSVLLTRWEATGDPAALGGALDALRDAAAAAPPDSPGSALFDTLLGLAELRSAVHRGPERSRLGHRLPDPLSAAVDRLRQAASAAVGVPRLLPFALVNLGTGLSARHLRDGLDADLAAGTDAYREAVDRAAAEDPQLALRAAVEWGDWATARRDWSDADDAYRSGIDAVDLLRRHQLVAGHKREWIALGGGLAEKAATAAVRARRPRHAATDLERCRAQLLGERLSTTRLDLTQLDDVAPGLAQRYRAAADRVRGLEAQAPYAGAQGVTRQW